MKIVFTGGGTGGHFYPIIAIADAVTKIAEKEKLLGLKLYYLSTDPYDKEALFESGIQFKYIPAGKMRVYFSVLNFFDAFKTAFGILTALLTLFSIYPDVVFCKGGYGSFPVVFAARLLRIPVIVHESDTVPGRVNKWAGKFARRIAVSYDETAQFFPKDKVAVTGQPIRDLLKVRSTDGAFDYLKLDPTIPTIFVMGGSLGSETINNIVVDSLPQLLAKYQVIHQTGQQNFEEVSGRAQFILQDNVHADRYRAFGFLNPLAIKMSAGAASLVVSRAGSTIFEIAAWGIPAIIIPIHESYGDHQRKNAYNYARHGAATVIEEDNLSPVIFVSEIDRFFQDLPRREKMTAAAKAFSTPDAAEKIGAGLIQIALDHEQ